MQLIGLYFLVGGLVGTAAPLMRHFAYNESWAMNVGSELAASGAAAPGGWLLLTRCTAVTRLMNRYAAG